MGTYKLKKGFTIPLEGTTDAEVLQADSSPVVAVRPDVFRGIKPKLLVKEGDSVKRGAALFCSKSNPDHIFTSPASGIVKAIERGKKRVIKHILIERGVADEHVDFTSYSAGQLNTLARATVKEQMSRSGAYAYFRQRPFDHVADPTITPRDIFVSTFDSAPLGPDLSQILAGHEADFQAGIDVASRLTDGKVHLSLDGDGSRNGKAFPKANNAVTHTFSGRHPAGCVGVQIHHIAPIKSRKDVVWYATVQNIISLGRLFLTGQLSADVVVGVAGSAATRRTYFRTTAGAAVASIVGDHVNAKTVRVISGNVLTGSNVGREGYVGPYDSHVTVIPESTGPEFIGWMLPGFSKPSYFRTFASPFLSMLNPKKTYAQDTKLNGGVRAFVATGCYDDVLPMRVYPLFLCKSILAGDIEEMEGLGIYEVTEEEVALCEYICPSKMEIQNIIRQGLDMIEKEG